MTGKVASVQSFSDFITAGREPNGRWLYVPMGVSPDQTDVYSSGEHRLAKIAGLMMIGG
jgi:hypothetical protein